MADSRSENTARILVREDEQSAHTETTVLDHSVAGAQAVATAEVSDRGLWQLASAVAQPPAEEAAARPRETAERGASCNPPAGLLIPATLPDVRTVLRHGAKSLILVAAAIGLAELICWYMAQ